LSEPTLDKIYKLIEYVLLNEEVSSDEILRSIADINEIAVTLNAWCLSNAYEQVYIEVCNKSFKALDESLEHSLKYIVLKNMEGKVKQSSNVLSSILSMISLAIDTLKRIIETSIVIQEEKVLCKVRKPIALSDKVVEKGYLTLLPIDTAVFLTVLGYVEPVQALFRR